MPRRLALLLALLSPVAGLAQTVTIVPSAFGLAACTSTTTSVTLTWTTSSTIATGDFFRVYVDHVSSCPTTGTPSGTQKGGDIAATTRTYPTSGTYSSATFIADAGITGCTANATLYVCVQHWQGGTSQSVKSVATGSAALEVEPPPVPVSVTVAPGDTALFVGWAAGTGNTVAAASYNVTAAVATNALLNRTQSFTSISGEHRVTGLTNGVTYDVTVTSVSAGGNESAPSAPPVPGTPQPVDGFWDQYVAAGGVEQGGCAGGAAGLVSLLGIALALRGLRRRP